ncbi:mechanosensitive ion channel family protein [Aestuariimicrobium ganziense]|uniref:mechanosensitive ion channel family protein n=1 Tax=Aestuariimicrobium ganziense TaxID=2773677 RepID=UPI0019436144|nr:mechanosensitive ion channel family protein [Aestuariimicrobium ganziense]
MPLLQLTWVWPDTLIAIVVVVVLAVLARVVVRFALTRVVGAAIRKRDEHAATLGQRAGAILARASGWDTTRQVQRAKTLGAMLGSVSTFVIATVALLTIMSMLGLPMAPLLASAGVGGVALGFGAQSLVKDFLSGVFLISEDQFGVGDVVDLGEVKGTIEDVGLRVTTVRDAGGKVWYVRNGEIIRVGNISQGWSNATIDIDVHYTSDATQVIGIIRQVVAEMDAEPEWKQHLLETPTVLGVESITGQTMTIRVIAKCVANQQWGVQRELRERAKNALDAAGVKGPGPELTYGG